MNKNCMQSYKAGISPNLKLALNAKSALQNETGSDISKLNLKS